jgi:YVTN family beta-propeller protein
MRTIARNPAALILLTFSLFGLLALGMAVTSYAAMASISSITSISVGPNPSEMVFDSKDNSVFVLVKGSGSGSASVVEINGATNAVITTLKVTQPRDIAYNPTNDAVYVTSANTGVSIINGATGKLITKLNIATNDFFQDVAYDPANGNMYVANSNPGTVSVISSSTNKVISTIKTGSSPQHIAFDATDNNMYIFVSTKSTTTHVPFVAVISSTTNNVLAKVKLTSSPGSYTGASLAYDPASSSMFVSDGSGNLYIVNNNAIVTTLPVTVTGMVFNPSNNYLYAVGANQVYVIGSGDSIATTISTPGSYLNAAYDSVNNDVYVGGSTVNVINAASMLTAQVTTGAPGFVVFDPAGGYIYASLMQSPGSLDVITSS